jgi:hypothetical protein
MLRKLLLIAQEALLKGFVFIRGCPALASPS